MKIQMRVQETVIEEFDCEIEIPDGLEGQEREDAITEAVEERRVNGNDERMFMEVSDADWWERTP